MWTSAPIYGNQPGYSGITETFESHVLWGREWDNHIVPAVISGAARDAGNTPTAVLRPGLLLGMISASGILKEYGGTATDGTAEVFGVLLTPLRMTDYESNDQVKFYGVLVAGKVKAAQLIGLDEAARASMAERFVFDDRQYIPARYTWRGPTAKTADYTVVNGTDQAMVFTNLGAGGAVNFTLPTTLKKGQRWRFLGEANQNLTVTAPAGKLVAFNNAAATSVALSTAGNKIGSGFEVLVNSDASKYLAMPIGVGTVTVA